MTIEDKISKIADWISNESDNRFDEIELLLYFIYQHNKSGLKRDIDDDYKDVIEIMSEREE
tara:strand:- start:772 stop:954 length:183 start_codon:yes stop_codon:yes gene_type:complete